MIFNQSHENALKVNWLTLLIILCVVWIALSLQGCLYQRVHPASSQPIMHQIGFITLQEEGKKTTLKTEYKEYSGHHFELTLFPPFSRSITLCCDKGVYRIKQRDVLFTPQETQEILAEWAQEFPWGQLPGLLQNGSLRSADWKLIDWDDQSFKLESTHHDHSLSWHCKKKIL